MMITSIERSGVPMEVRVKIVDICVSEELCTLKMEMAGSSKTFLPT
jgi:hypothetical protein